MRALLLAACALLLVAAVPAVEAAPPGGSCHVNEEYVTEAYTTGSVLDGTFAVHPGATRLVECYY
ncbi:MAG: hypothetical protein QOG31_1046 [Thermoplasmata archaeon]|jgi:hypothetical protein|nr:hypothetical protein [Thermoplasmata archaeon]